MKKIFCLLILIILISFCGCKNKSSGVTAVTTGLKFTAAVDCDGKSYECLVEVSESSTITVKAISPESLKGMTYSFSGSDVKIDFNGLTYRTDASLLPNNSVFGFLYYIFSDADKHKEAVTERNDELLIAGKTDKYDYSMFLGSSGLPIKVADRQTGITAIINNATIL